MAQKRSAAAAGEDHAIGALKRSRHAPKEGTIGKTTRSNDKKHAAKIFRNGKIVKPLQKPRSPAELGRQVRRSGVQSVHTKAPEKLPASRLDERTAAKSKLEKRKPILGLVNQVVSIWEDLRPRDASKELKRKLAGKVLAASKGKLRELSMNHASARVVQATLKYGGDPAAQALWKDCGGHVLDMAMSPHASHVLRKLIRLGTDEIRSGILRACHGSVVKLFRHPIGSATMAELYEGLPASERNAMVAEFYSREWAVLGGVSSAAGQLSSLTHAWPSLDGVRQRAVIKHLITALEPILEKGYVDPTPIHRLLAEYLALAPSDLVRDAAEVLAGEPIVRMAHTHDGAGAGCAVLGYATARQRKKAVKAMKGHATKMALDEFAYTVLLQALLVTDDTQLVRKCLVTELGEQLKSVVDSKHGIKVFLSLLCLDERHLPPHAVSMLHVRERTVAAAPGADVGAAVAGEEATGLQVSGGAQSAAPEPPRVRLGESKKDPATRRLELLGSGTGCLARALLEHCSLHTDALMRTALGADLVCNLACGDIVGKGMWQAEQEAIKALHGAVAKALDAPAAVTDADLACASGKVRPQSGACPLVEDFFASRAVCRSIRAHNGSPACDAFCAQLWSTTCAGKCTKLVAGHGAKVVAAVHAACRGSLRDDIEAEIAECVDGDVSTWAEMFVPRPKEKKKQKVLGTAAL